MNWISVEERLPPEVDNYLEQYLLVRLDTGAYYTAHRKGYEWWDPNCWIKFYNVTHWCYIEKPEEI